jgi:hypothetical protein
MARAAALLAAVVAVASCYGGTESENLGVQSSALVGFTGVVHGGIESSFTASPVAGTIPVAMPLSTVFIKNGAFVSPSVKTDLNGFFSLSQIPNGTGNQICWSSPSLGSACGTAFSANAKGITYPPHEFVPPRPRWVYGTVTRPDGSPVHIVNGTFSTDVRVSVKLTNSANATVAGPVTANGIGQYMIGTVPSTPGTYNVVATSELSTVSTPVVVTSTSAGLAANLVLPNHAPVITSVYASQGGSVVRNVVPGSSFTVNVQATDADGDALQYSWQHEGGGTNPCTLNTATATATCSLPAATKFHGIIIRVKDGKNGYAFGRVNNLRAGAATTSFSGVVVSATTALPINNASASVWNGTATTSATTGATGAFTLTPATSNQFVLTVKAAGYLTYSQVVPDQLSGKTIRLTPATATPFDPATGVTLNTAVFNVAGTALPPATLQIPANALVNEITGVLPPAGTTLVGYFDEISYRANSGGMPGDGTATDTDGSLAVMQSFSAMEVNIFDSSGNRYQLRSGQVAGLVLYADPLKNAYAPASAPLWYYNETTGVWNRNFATYVAARGGAGGSAGYTYSGSVPHFSIVNVDLAKTNADCIEVDKSAFPGPIDVQVSIDVSSPLALQSPQERTLDDQAIAAITRVPANTDVTIKVWDTKHQGFIPGATKVVHTGNASTGPGGLPLLPPDLGVLPYYDLANGQKCHSKTKLEVVLPAEGIGAASVFLQHNVSSTNASTPGLYYNDIDPGPTPTRTTFAAWKLANHFDLGEDAHADYANLQDLGIGRSMHMKKTINPGDGQYDYAFYVVNYGNSQNGANLAHAGGVTGAAVAMEYSRPLQDASQPRFTKFYIFDAKNVDDTLNLRLDGVDLDLNGLKYAPEVCITCHGGSTQNANYAAGPANWAGDLGSLFLPFDVSAGSFKMPDNLLLSAQQEDFYKLNQAVKSIALDAAANDPLVGNTAVAQVIDAWYSVPAGTHVADTTKAPSGWTGAANQSQFYLDVVSKSCRSCHVTRDPNLDWNSWANISNTSGQALSIPFDVCSANPGGKIMPQSKVTWELFWGSTSPSQPAQVQSVLLPILQPGGLCQ